MGEAYIIDAVRTPRGIGKQGKGALAAEHPQHLAATVLKAVGFDTGRDAGGRHGPHGRARCGLRHHLQWHHP